MAADECPKLSGSYRERTDGSTLTIRMDGCERLTHTHSLSGTFTLPLDGKFRAFEPPVPDAEDRFRTYRARAQASADTIVCEFEASRDGKILWVQTARYRLDAQGNLISEDSITGDPPPGTPKFHRYVFEPKK